MSKRYEAFVENPGSVPEGQEMGIFIKDLTPGPRKYDVRFVKAVLSSSPDKAAGKDTLQLRSFGGRMHPKNFAIEILEDLGEYVPGVPYTKHTGLFPPEANT